MRVVHLADLHLGFRQYQRLAPGGINQREADIAQTFQRAVDRIIELQPDVIAVAGDVFHSVRPTNPAIVHAFRQLTRLVQELPETIVVMVAGNHDTPRTAETGGILQLFSGLGIHVADRQPLTLEFPERDLFILAVPDTGGERPALIPMGGFRRNLLVIHGEVEGVLPPQFACPDRRPMEIPLRDLNAERWSYVALGHYHVYREVAPACYYSGALEYASTNIWGEVAEESAGPAKGKGVVEHDLDTGDHVFHQISVARAVVDLAPLRARGMTAPELDLAVRDAVDGCEGGIDGKIVRLVAFDVPHHVSRALDHRALREYRRRALHFHLDFRRPQLVRPASVAAGGRRASLSELLRDSLRSRHLEPDVEREELVSLGLRYLHDAESSEAPVLVEVEE